MLPSHRGVFVVSTTPTAPKVLIAYDRFNNPRETIIVPRDADLEELGSQLWDYLNIVDPGASRGPVLPLTFTKVERRLRHRSHLRAV